MVDKGTISRRALDFEDYIDILRRNLSWLAGPIFAGLVVSTVVAYLWPDTYISRAVVRVIPQQISGELVQNVSSQDMLSRITGLAQVIESRTALETLINKFDLYKKERSREPLDDVIATMRDAVKLTPMGVGSSQEKAFQLMEVSFKYRERTLAFKVCGELVSNLLNLSTQESTTSQSSANAFLTGEARAAKAELETAEQKLSDYRVKHAGALPEEMQANVQQMTSVQQRLNSLSDAATRVSERRLMLESSLRIAKDRMSAVHEIGPISLGNDRVSDLDRQITDLEGTVASMKDRYTADYPDLQAAQERLAVLRKQRDDMSKSASKSGSNENPLVARERLDAQGQIDSINSQLKATSLEEQQISRELLVANSQLRAYQARLQASPVGEKEYADLLQARDVARQKFLDADSKAHKSDVSLHMEQGKQGETLEQIDAPSLPTEPTEPKRAMIIPIGAVCGLVLGIILVAMREVKDTSLKNLKDARAYTHLPILGTVPLLEKDIVVQRRKSTLLIGWAAAGVVGVAIIVGTVAHYLMNRA